MARHNKSFVATAVGLALTFGLVACGGDGASAGGKNSRGPWADSADWPKPDYFDPHGVGDKAQVREVISDVQRDFPAKIGSGVCHELTPNGQREIVETGISVYRTCKEIVPEITRRMRIEGIGPRFSKVLDVRINGDRATALLQDPGKPPYGVPLVNLPKLGWKLPSLLLVEPIDFATAALVPDSSDPRIRKDRTEIEEILNDVQADFAAGYGSNVCAELSERARRELERSGLAKQPDCGLAVNELLRRMKDEGIERRFSKVTKVAIRGNTAFATVEDRRGKAGKAKFVEREFPVWRLDRLSDAEPIQEVWNQR